MGVFSKLAFISISAFELNQTQDGSFKIGKAFRSNSEPKHGDISQTRRNERSFGETNRKKYCYFVRFSNRRHNCFLLWSGKTQEDVYAEWHRTVDPDAMYERMKSKGVFWAFKAIEEYQEEQAGEAEEEAAEEEAAEEEAAEEEVAEEEE